MSAILAGQYIDFHNEFYTCYRENFPPPKVILISTPIFMIRKSDLAPKIYLMNKNQFKKYYFSRDNLLSLKLYEYHTLFQKTPVFLYHLLSGKRKKIHGYMEENHPELKKKSLNQIKSYKKSTNRIVNYLDSDYNFNTKNNQDQLNQFHKILASMQKDGVSVFLIETPEYIGTQETYTERDAFYKDLQEVISGYTNVTIITQKEIYEIDPTDRSLFSDGGWREINSHLSIKGSKIYTKSIINRITHQLRSQ